MIIAGFVFGLVLYGVVMLARCSFRVEEGELAVLTTFGAAARRADGKGLATHGPGLHGKMPWQKVVRVSVKEQNLELSGEAGGRSAMAEDGTLLRFDSILRYVPVEAELEGFLFGMRAPLEHITGLFTCLLRNEIANFHGESSGPEAAAGASSGALNGAPAATASALGAFGAASTRALPSMLLPAHVEAQTGSYALIRRERRLLNERIEGFCRERIGHRYGVRFNAVDLVDILPPDDLADALNAVMYAQAEAEAQLFRAQGECQQRILGAERGVAIAKAHAEAAATEIETLAEYLGALEERGVLGAYVQRRQSEVYAESRAVFVKEGEDRA